MLRQFFSFAGVGVIGTAAHYLVLIVAVQAGVDSVIASVLGCAVGATVNYLLNYRFTFRSRLAHRASAPRSAAIAVSALILNTVLMAVAVKGLGLHYLLAQVLATGAILGLNFLLNRYWVFRPGGTEHSP